MSDDVIASVASKGSKIVKRTVALQFNKVDDVRNWFKVRYNLLGKDYQSELKTAKEFLPEGDDSGRAFFARFTLPIDNSQKDKFDTLYNQMILPKIEQAASMGVKIDFNFDQMNTCVLTVGTN